jgi:hypothetical protein
LTSVVDGSLEKVSVIYIDGLFTRLTSL